MSAMCQISDIVEKSDRRVPSGELDVSYGLAFEQGQQVKCLTGTDESTERVCRSISTLLITYSLTNHKIVGKTTYETGMIPQSLRLIIASMTAIEEERRGLCAVVLSRFHHGFKTPAVTAE